MQQQDVETAARQYYGGPQSAARIVSPAVAERLNQWRQLATCAHCRQRIAVGVELVTRGAFTFHRTCAGAWERAQQAPAARSAAAQVIGVLAGTAVLIGQPCECRLDGGPVREQFQSGAFDRWLRAGVDVGLKIDHEGAALAGRYRLLEEQRGALVWRFELHDGPRERIALRHARAGEVHGCSIAFRPVLHQWGWNAGDVLMRTDVRLTEISLCIAGRPAWCGTHCRAEA